jgi:HTH-type transcriptional regulator / antitoxin HipB
MYIRSPRDLGLVVREARRSQKLTQAELAARAGVTREWIVGLERGNRGAEVGRVFKVLTALRLGLNVPTETALTHSNASVPSRIDTIVVKAARNTP